MRKKVHLVRSFVQLFFFKLTYSYKNGRLDPLCKNRNITVQSRTKFGAPLTLGVKISPRKCLHQDSRIIGFEIIVYSELWLKNLTDLPIVFGAPSFEILNPLITGIDQADNYGSSVKLAAYSALLEFNDLLDFDFNERDKDFNKTNEDFDILTLSVQESNTVVGESILYFIQIVSIQESHKSCFC